MLAFLGANRGLALSPMVRQILDGVGRRLDRRRADRRRHHRSAAPQARRRPAPRHGVGRRVPAGTDGGDHGTRSWDASTSVRRCDRVGGRRPGARRARRLVLSRAAALEAPRPTSDARPGGGRSGGGVGNRQPTRRRGQPRLSVTSLRRMSGAFDRRHRGDRRTRMPGRAAWQGSLPGRGGNGPPETGVGRVG